MLSSMWLELRPEHRRYVLNETVVSVVLNVIVSAAFAWFPFHTIPTMPLWGLLGIVADLVPTTFMITLMVTVALTLITRRRIHSGHVSGLAALPAGFRFLQMLPHYVLSRALTLAAGLTLLLVPAIAGLFVLTGIHSMSFGTFFAFKLLYGALLAILITPPVVLAALADQARRPR